MGADWQGNFFLKKKHGFALIWNNVAPKTKTCAATGKACLSLVTALPSANKDI